MRTLNDVLTTVPKQWGGLIAGLFLGLVAVSVGLILPSEMEREFFAMLLFGIATIYLGFAVADGRPREIAIEVTVIVVFGLLALGGLWFAPVLLVIGYFAHGIWDVVHHPHGVQTSIRRWYPPFCLVVDWVISVYLLGWLLTS